MHPSLRLAGHLAGSVALGSWLLFPACTDRDEPGDGAAARPVVDSAELTARVLSVDPRIGLPYKLALTDDGLWVLDAAEDPALHLLDPTTGDLIASMGRSGGGPGEFETLPFSIQRDPASGGALWAFDPAAKRLTRFTDSDPLGSPGRMISLPASYFRVAWLNPNRLVAVAIAFGDTASGFAMLDSAAVEVGAAPRSIEVPEGTPADQVMRAWTSAVSLCVKPGGSQFVGARRNFGRVAFYDSLGTLTGLGRIPAPTDTVFRFDEDRGEYRFRASGRRYQACAATDERIYLVYTGEPEGETMEDLQVGRWIHVLDWNGELRAVYRLDTRLSGIALSSDGSILYGASMTDASVSIFDLPNHQ